MALDLSGDRYIGRHPRCSDPERLWILTWPVGTVPTVPLRSTEGLATSNARRPDSGRLAPAVHARREVIRRCHPDS